MGVRSLKIWPDAALRTVCDPVETISPAIEKLAADLLDTMYDAPGRGLAAPKVGELLRVFVMDATWKDGKADPQVFINPKILDTSEDKVSLAEGCLSIPGILTEISRPARIKIEWTGLTGGRYVQVFDGFSAACIQHEIDHLDGVVTFDRLSEPARVKALKEYEVLQ